MPTTDGKEQCGLSEFSNANFLSKKTIFTDNLDRADKHFFPFPKRANAQVEVIEITDADGKNENVLFYSKAGDGVKIDRLAKGKYFREYGNGYQVDFFLDDEVHQEYAQKLIPKAVGYTAGLLNYFFRGDMDIRKAYVRLGPGMTITGIDFEVKNTSFLDDQNQTLEPFGAGTIDVSCQYFMDGVEDPFYIVEKSVYTVTDTNDEINSDYVSISAEFLGGQTIPLGAKDISFTVVFRGKLGNEEGAVAAKHHPFNEYSRIAYTFQPGGDGNESDIFTILPDGTDAKQITNSVTPNRFYYAPSWSPDGTKMAFSKELCTDPNPEDGCSGEYWTVDIDVIDLTSPEPYPGNLTRTLKLPRDSGQWFTGEPFLEGTSFSPDGNQIVAIATGLARWDGALAVFNTATGAGGLINDWEFWLSKSVRDSPPAWSPNGDKIAYYVYEENDGGQHYYVLRRDICLINPDGTGDQWLTYDDYNNACPTWSPDGDWIIFVSDRDGGGNLDIWIMDRMGQDKQKVRDCEPDCVSPSFSPDGLRIAFKQGEDIYTINLDGSNLTQVTSSGYSTDHPVWSPVLPEPGRP